MTLRKIGSVWRKQNDGKTFFSGQMEFLAGIKTHIVLMPFVKKKEDNKNYPAYDIFVQVQEEGKEKQDIKNKQNIDDNND